MSQAPNVAECHLRLEVRGRAVVVWPDGGMRPEDAWFDPHALTASGGGSAGGTGRGGTLLFDADGHRLILRHYRRGGMVRHLVSDRYLRTGVRNSRPWRELAILARLHAGGMPVPRPYAARIAPAGILSPWYRGDLVTGYLAGTRTLAESIRVASPEETTWFAIGETIARFHAAGVDHADLNAHNVLLDESGTVYLIDFDRARLRSRPGRRWAEGNLARLRRSLDKLTSQEEAGFTFSEADWAALERGYRDAGRIVSSAAR